MKGEHGEPGTKGDIGEKGEPGAKGEIGEKGQAAPAPLENFGKKINKNR